MKGLVLVTPGQRVEQIGLMLSYNPSTGKTRGLIHYHKQEAYPTPGTFKQDVEKTMNSIRHPMILPILVAEYVIEECSTQCTTHDGKILTYETRTGQNRYWFGKDTNKFTSNYRLTTLDLNALLTDIEWTIMKLESLALIHCRVKELHVEIHTKTPQERRDRVETDFVALQKMMDHQESVIRNMLLSENSTRERARAQLNAVSYKLPCSAMFIG